MTRREQICRERLRAQMHVQPIQHGEVCIFCPAAIADRFYQHLVAKRISTSTPKRAIFGRYPEDELIAALPLDVAQAEISEFVATLPEPCYERDVN